MKHSAVKINWEFALTFAWWFLRISQSHHTLELKPRVCRWAVQCWASSLSAPSVPPHSGQPCPPPPRRLTGCLEAVWGEAWLIRGCMPAGRSQWSEAGGRLVYELRSMTSFCKLWSMNLKLLLLTQETGYGPFWGLELLVYGVFCWRQHS